MNIRERLSDATLTEIHDLVGRSWQANSASRFLLPGCKVVKREDNASHDETEEKGGGNKDYCTFCQTLMAAYEAYFSDNLRPNYETATESAKLLEQYSNQLSGLVKAWERRTLLQRLETELSWDGRKSQHKRIKSINRCLESKRTKKFMDDCKKASEFIKEAIGKPLATRKPGGVMKPGLNNWLRTLKDFRLNVTEDSSAKKQLTNRLMANITIRIHADLEKIVREYENPKVSDARGVSPAVPRKNKLRRFTISLADIERSIRRLK